MTFLIRKINKAKWFQIDIDNDDDVSADAITNDLKTIKNTLSAWRIGTVDEIEEAILAMVSKQDHLETIDVIILNEQFLQNSNIDVIASRGDTPIESLVDTHRDLADLTFSKIKSIKDHIVEGIRTDRLKRYTRESLRKIIVAGIQEGKLDFEDLKESVQNKMN